MYESHDGTRFGTIGPPESSSGGPLQDSEQLLSQLSSKLRPYLDASESLRTEGCSSAVNYPSIVVIGDQSEGKSTVMEAVANVKLPKDTRLCTKCPIQLSLRKGSERAEISYKLGSNNYNKVIAHDDIKNQIELAQEALVASAGSQITDETIRVLIQRPNGFDLTLIDLPGINRYTNEIEDQTIKIIERFIESEQAIIIVVFKCTTDVSAVKAFQLSRKFDPSGKRTIGVITHCDTLSENWEEQIGELVSGRQADVATRVFIPVACRDFIARGPLAERDVLLQRKVFRRLDPALCGTRQLLVRLCNEVMQKLAPWKEEIAGLVTKRRRDRQEDLNRLLDGEPTESADSRQIACTLLSKFAREVEEQVTGTHRTDKNVLYAKCQRHLNEFENGIRESTDQTKSDEALAQEIKEEFRDQRGSEFELAAHIFPVQRRIVKALVTNEYQPRATEVFSTIWTAVQDHMLSVADEMFANHPPFKDFLKEKLSKIATSIRDDARKKLLDLLSMEATCIQTRNPQFKNSVTKNWKQIMGSGSYVQDTLDRRHSSLLAEHTDDDDHSTSESEFASRVPESLGLDFNEQRVYSLVKEYLGILANRLIDSVAITIDYHLNHKLAEKISSIHSLLPDAQTLHDLMQNPEKADRICQVRQQLELWRGLEEKLKQQSAGGPRA